MEGRRRQPRYGEQDIAVGGGGGERVLQWSPAETREFLGIRAELDRRFGETKRNKALWEGLSLRMLEKGFARTPDQCKSKWKNLLTRFKGSEAMEAEGSRQFPYYEEMRGIFSGRMQRLLNLEKELGEESERAQEDEDDEGKGKKKKAKRVKNGGGGGEVALEELEWVLMELGRRQKERVERWLDVSVERDAQRRAAELEWRGAMEAVWGERAEMERWWRERQEERRRREEIRAQRRDEVISSIIDKLDNERDDEVG